MGIPSAKKMTLVWSFALLVCLAHSAQSSTQGGSGGHSFSANIQTASSEQIKSSNYFGSASVIAGGEGLSEMEISHVLNSSSLTTKLHRRSLASSIISLDGTTCLNQTMNSNCAGNDMYVILNFLIKIFVPFYLSHVRNIHIGELDI